MQVRGPELTEENYALYARYITERHRDGDMYPPSREQFASFLLCEWSDTAFIEFRRDEQLIAVAVTDRVEDGLSAIYTFYDPDMHHFSPGVYAILWQIEHARQTGRPHLYLGYWIKQCQKMSYKTDYRPLEMFVGERWIRVS